MADTATRQRVQPLGLHHVTAVATDPQANVDFYLRVLGLRLVKQTVNFDAPDTYHLYYGDEQGTPGSILTFFPWPGAPRGRRGTGQASTVSFSVPEGSLGWWRDHLERLRIQFEPPRSRLEEDVLVLYDPDGLRVELAAHHGVDERSPWERGPVPVAQAIRGLHSVTLSEADGEDTANLFVNALGFRPVAEDGDRFRFDVGDGGPGRRVDVLREPGAPQGLVAAGTVHHVAWRAPDAPTQRDWRSQLVADAHNVTPVLDRNYFQSIYFREPGGVLLEIATDPPGFGIDEPLLELGRKLRLPPWMEPNRAQIEAHLPELKLPEPDQWADSGDAS